MYRWYEVANSALAWNTGRCVRLAAVAVTQAVEVFTAVRLARFNALTITRFAERRREIDLLSLSLVYPAAAFWAGAGMLTAPFRLSGHTSSAFHRRVLAVYEHFRRKSQVPTNERSQLTDQLARQRKKKYIIYEFRKILGLNVVDGQAETFSHYAQTGELMKDFLDFCV